MELVVAAAGVAFLAVGLRGWAMIAGGNDTTGARTPVPYGARLELPAELDTLPAAVRWIIIVTNVQAARACRQLLDGTQPADRRPVGLVVVTGAGQTELSICAPNTPPGAREVRLASAAPARGFVVTDRAGRVVYGSFERRLLGQALASLAVVE